jgi:hypothetical protein
MDASIKIVFIYSLIAIFLPHAKNRYRRFERTGFFSHDDGEKCVSDTLVPTYQTRRHFTTQTLLIIRFSTVRTSNIILWIPIGRLVYSMSIDSDIFFYRKEKGTGILLTARSDLSDYTVCHIPVDHILKIHRCENLEFYTFRSYRFNTFCRRRVYFVKYGSSVLKKYNQGATNINVTLWIKERATVILDKPLEYKEIIFHLSCNSNEESV